uniref:Bet v I/Major latex protein domain-containing protein n=1 Tax=Fagus sylvatica TaxID=28930 RepID=A0A2N9GPZ6_FAGSY
MSLFGKLEAEAEAKAPAYKFHEVNTTRIPETAKICPKFFQRVDLQEGEWGGEGSVTCWYFIIDGKAVMSKEVLEAVDNKNQSVTYNVIGGVLKELYKSFKFIVQATPKGEGALVRWTLVYEKLNVDVPDPTTMLQFGIDVTKEIDDYLNQE